MILEVAATCQLISGGAAFGASGSIDPCLGNGLVDGELSLARAVQIALCSNADVRSAAETVQVRSAQVGEARSEYWSLLSATATELGENTSYPGSAMKATTD